MDEEKTQTEDTKVKSNENNNEGVQPKTVTELDRADQIAERLKRENDRREELISREENLAARKAIGGVAEAGQETPKPKEETPSEYKDRVMSGKHEE